MRDILLSDAAAGVEYADLDPAAVLHPYRHNNTGVLRCVEQSIGKFLGDPPRRYESGKGKGKLEGCIFDIDPETGRCISAEGIRIT